MRELLIMNIVLIGFMGTGKTTVGKLLATELDFQFVDADALIESKAGKSITQIFQSEGEGYFRKLEASLAEELAAGDHQVIATGGGFVLNSKNILVFKPQGLIIALKASTQSIYERIRAEKHRPLLAVSDPLTRIRQLLLEREPYYQKADWTIDTDGKIPADLVREIGAELVKRGLLHGRSQTELS
jgi:shikimate kinase